jgi:hypothetical protein
MGEPELFSDDIAYMSGISGTLIKVYTAIGPYIFVLCGFCILLGFLISAVALLSFV